MTPDFDSTVFVIMPFGEGQEARVHKARYQQLIQRAVKAAEDPQRPLTCLRSDEVLENGPIPSRVVDYLLKSRVVIADLCELNANVMYELGIRHATRYGTVLIAPDSSSRGFRELPFNLKNLDVVKYSDHAGLMEEAVDQLTPRIRACLGSTPLNQDSPVRFDALRDRLSNIDEAVVASLGKQVASELTKNPQWASEAIAKAGIAMTSGTVFGRRLEHFRDEKRLIAKEFVPFLLDRCKQLLTGEQPAFSEVCLLIDSGTTLVPVVEELAKRAKEVDRGEAWLSHVKIYTNNLAGAEAMMEHRLPAVPGHLPALPIECHLLPGEPVAEYSAVLGQETEDAVEALAARANAQGKTVLIGLMTGNWIRMRRNGEHGAVPLARGGEHIRFKQKLLDTVLTAADGNVSRGEVFIIAPLGKIFYGHSNPGVTKALQLTSTHVPEGTATGVREELYKELNITNEQARRVSLVTTARLSGRVLTDLGNHLKAHLGCTDAPTGIEFAAAPLGSPHHLFFDFDELHPIWARQIEQEFPHDRTRIPEFAKMFYTRLQQAHR